MSTVLTGQTSAAWTSRIARPALIRTLQIGMHWFAERQGGLERYYYDLISHLPAARVNVRGLVLGTPSVERLSDGTVSSVCRADAWPIKRFAALREYVKWEIEEFRPDCVCSHFALYARPILGLLKGLPLVVHFHGPWYAEGKAEGAGGISSWARYRIERTVYRQADRVIALSTAFKQILVGEFGVEESRVRVIPGGVDVRRFAISQTRREAREVLGWPQDRPIILSVRRLTERMGMENLIRASALLKKRRSDALIVLAGSGHLRRKLEEQIGAAGLQDHVRLHGFIAEEQLPLAYGAADFSMVPSNSLEGFGLVVIESLASGTPVIVTPVGGLPEIVRPLNASLLCADSTPEAMAQTMLYAIDHQGILPGPGRCREYARRFDWTRVVQAVRQVLDGAMGSN